MDFLISFEHKKIPTDTAEEVSDFLLYPARLAFGRMVEEGQEREITLLGRAVGLSICMIALSIILPLTLIGIITNLFSKTHAQKVDDFRTRERGFEPIESDQ